MYCDVFSFVLPIEQLDAIAMSTTSGLSVYALNFNATVDYLVGFFTKEQLLFVIVRTP